MKTNPVRARGKRSRHAELRIRFGFMDGRRQVSHACSFIALWRDQFGTVHFTATSDWDAEMPGIGHNIRQAYERVKA